MNIWTYVVALIMGFSFFSTAGARSDIGVHVKVLDEVWDPTQCASNAGHLLYCYEIINSIVEGSTLDNSTFLIPAYMFNAQDFVVLLDAAGDPIYKNELIIAVKKSEALKKQEYILQYSDFKAFNEKRNNFKDRFARFVVDTKYRAKNLNFLSVEEKLMERLITPENRVSIVTTVYTKYMVLRGHDPYAKIEPFNTRYADGDDILGMRIFFFQDQMYIVEVKPNSVLDKAGIAVGDVVVSINGIKALPENLSEIFRQVRASVSKHQISVEVKKVDAAKTVKLSYQAVFKKSNLVSSYEYTVGKKQIGVVAIQTFFKQGICEGEIASHLRKLLQPRKNEKSIDALILDLRSNGGGWVEESDCMLGLFLGSEKDIYKEVLLKDGILYKRLTEQDKQLPEVIRKTTATQIVPPNLPLSILVNGDTSSVAELTPLVFREYERGWIVGQKTYGKGIAQQKVENPLNGKIGWGLDLWVSVSRYELLNGYSSHIRGVTPDIEALTPLSGADGEKMVTRFTDENGTAFASATVAEAISDQRKAVQKEIEKCLPSALAGVSLSEPSARWLRDQQLRRATEVALCIPVAAAPAK